VTPSKRTESTNGIWTPAIVRHGMAEALVRSLAPVPNTIASVLLGFNIRPLERNHLTTWSAHFERSPMLPSFGDMHKWSCVSFAYWWHGAPYCKTTCSRGATNKANNIGIHKKCSGVASRLQAVDFNINTRYWMLVGKDVKSVIKIWFNK